MDSKGQKSVNLAEIMKVIEKTFSNYLKEMEDIKDLCRLTLQDQ